MLYPYGNSGRQKVKACGYAVYDVLKDFWMLLMLSCSWEPGKYVVICNCEVPVCEMSYQPRVRSGVL